jgi:hypothetical protein
MVESLQFILLFVAEYSDYCCDLFREYGDGGGVEVMILETFSEL